MSGSRVRALAAAAVLAPVLGCADAGPNTASDAGPDETVRTVDTAAVEEPAPEATPIEATPEAVPADDLEPPKAQPSDGRARDALLSIPALGIRDVQVVSYRGFTDDAEGTDIRNGGVAASPTGPRGGAGPGGVGNYQVTAHRLSAGGIFQYLPDLGRGDRIRVAAGDTTYVYAVRRTRITSFRSAESLREQRAAVPGRPGVEPTRAMVTLSTCRTLEDHAEGNYWSDEFDNPENRIDKIGVLVRTIEG
ncbi:sortase [Nocardioidaceae bacterium]|nr:sortase [Nocardioidaceae bacterium]